MMYSTTYHASNDAYRMPLASSFSSAYNAYQSRNLPSGYATTTIGYARSEQVFRPPETFSYESMGMH